MYNSDEKTAGLFHAPLSFAAGFLNVRVGRAEY